MKRSNKSEQLARRGAFEEARITPREEVYGSPTGREIYEQGRKRQHSEHNQQLDPTLVYSSVGLNNGNGEFGRTKKVRHSVKTINFKKFLYVISIAVFLGVAGVSAGLVGMFVLANDGKSEINSIENRLDALVTERVNNQFSGGASLGSTSSISTYGETLTTSSGATTNTIPWLKVDDTVSYNELDALGAAADKYVVSKKILDEKADNYVPKTTVTPTGTTTPISWVNLDYGTNTSQDIYAALPNQGAVTKGMVEDRLSSLNTDLTGAKGSLATLNGKVSTLSTTLTNLDTNLKANYYTKTETTTELDKKADKATTYTKTEVDGLISDLFSENVFKNFEADKITDREFNATTGTIDSGETVNYGWATSGTAIKLKDFVDYFGMRDDQYNSIVESYKAGLIDPTKMPEIKFYFQDRRGVLQGSETSASFKLNVLSTPTDVISELSLPVGKKDFPIQITLDTTNADANEWTVIISDNGKDTQASVAELNKYGSVYAIDIKYGAYIGTLTYASEKEVYSEREVDEILRKITAQWKSDIEDYKRRVEEAFIKINTLTGA